MSGPDPDSAEVIATDALLDHLAAGGKPLPDDPQYDELTEIRDAARKGEK